MLLLLLLLLLLFWLRLLQIVGGVVPVSPECARGGIERLGS